MPLGNVDCKPCDMASCLAHIPASSSSVVAAGSSMDDELAHPAAEVQGPGSESAPEPAFDPAEPAPAEPGRIVDTLHAPVASMHAGSVGLD